MFKADVYRIAIHSLGAILEEEHLAQMTINKWNEDYAEDKGKLFLQVPANSTNGPDVNVVIVDSFIDATKVDRIIAIGKPVVVLFSKYHDPKNSMQTELDAIAVYRKKIQDYCLCFDYENKAEFTKVLLSAINEINL